MEAAGLDCMVATTRENVYYSSGSNIMTIDLLRRMAAVVIPLDRDPVFLVHANEEVTARETTWIRDVRVYPGGEWEPLKPVGFLAEALRGMGLAQATIGVETWAAPGAHLDCLRGLLPSAEFTDCGPIFERLRAVKTGEEIGVLGRAAMATAKAITVAFEMARPGDTEREIARNMMDLAFEYGADGIAFMVLAAGENIFETHHTPGGYRIREGDLLHTDFGGWFDGYLSDISRMAVVGEPDDDQSKAYRFAVEAERAAAETLTAGNRVMEVHEAAREFYESRGVAYGRAFIGHGIGLGCHEAPFLGPSHGGWLLEPGMVFEVEPSVTFGRARMHTEDTFLVTENGPEILSDYRDTTEIQVIR